MLTSNSPKHPDVPSYDDELASTRELLQEVLMQADNPIVSTKFNPRTGVLLHMLSELAPGIPVVWVDTGYNTRDTQQFARYLEALLSLNLQVYKPENFTFGVPPELDTEEHDKFVQAVKLEPFQRAMDELTPDAWFTSIRQSQTGHRRSLDHRQVLGGGMEKISPLLSWPTAYMDRYLKSHGIALGPDCYDPTKGEAMRECGLHTKLWTDKPSAALHN